jgi:hypothetical protein
MMEGGRELFAGLRLLDLQIIDKDGMMSGKVDDLEFSWPEAGGPPYVSAILAGPGALARRLGGRLGAVIEAVFERLHPDEHPGPARIDAALIKSIGNHVELSADRESLGVTLLGRWVRDRIISKIPGSGHAAE